MSKLQEILGAYAPGHALDHGGKTFTFRAIDQKTKAALEASFYGRKRAAVYALRDGLSDEDYARQLDRLTDRHARGEFGFLEEEVMRWYMGAGLATLVATVTGEPLPECERLAADRTRDVLHLLWCVIGASFPNVLSRLLEAERSGDQGVTKLIEFFKTP